MRFHLLRRQQWRLFTGGLSPSAAGVAVGFFCGASGMPVFAVTGVATAAHHYQRSLIPVSCEPETTMQAAQLLHHCLLPQQAFEIRIGGLSIFRVPGGLSAIRK